MYGVGATVELPQLSAMVLGLDDWPKDSGALVSEPRLVAAIRRRLGAQVAELRTPPRSDDPGVNGVGVPVAPFPRWLLCPVCRLLAPLESGLFPLRRDPWRPDRTRHVHECTTRGLPPIAFPARFLLACRNGHLDDFPLGRVRSPRQGSRRHASPARVRSGRRPRRRRMSRSPWNFGVAVRGMRLRRWRA